MSGEECNDPTSAREQKGKNNQIMKFNDECDLVENYEEEVNPSGDSFIVLHLDIEEPLHKLRKAAEEKLNVDLQECGVWLLNSQQLDDQKNLVEQGVEGEGMVQMHVEVKIENDIKKINIIDVLKPAEEYVDIENESDESDEGSVSEVWKMEAKEQDLVRWIVDPQFKKERAELSIPEDPVQWNPLHVGFWLQWAMKQFHLSDIDLRQWNITGQDLCNMTLEEFHNKVPNDKGDLFWTHLELLRKCKLVAIAQAKSDNNSSSEVIERSKPKRKKQVSRPRILSKSRIVIHKTEEAFSLPSPNRSGNNGQIQLWQFLLELLTDWRHIDIIRWRGTEGEFRFVNPDEVARLWGVKKHKPAMNYEKLSRALRYYYEGDMISKVQSKRFVYKYVCNLKEIIGYDAKELRALVMEGAVKNGKELSYSPDDLGDS